MILQHPAAASATMYRSPLTALLCKAASLCWNWGTPEALHWLLRVSRYGKGHDQPFFHLLKSRFANSH